MVLFKKCCCCWSLEQGCLILAFVNLVGSIFGLIYSVSLILTGVRYQASPDRKVAASGFNLVWLGSVLFSYFVLSFTFAVILMVGLNKRNPKLIKAYLIYCTVSLTIYAILLVVRLATDSSKVDKVIEGVINLLVSIYYLLVIKSHHQTLLEEKSASENSS